MRSDAELIADAKAVFECCWDETAEYLWALRFAFGSPAGETG